MGQVRRLSQGLPGGLADAAQSASLGRGHGQRQETSTAAESGGLFDYLTAARNLSLLLALAGAQLVGAIAGGVILGLSQSIAPISANLVLGGMLASGGCAALLSGVRWHALIDQEIRLRSAPPNDPLSSQVAQALARIRYQASVSSGWTSSLKLSSGNWSPFGIEAGITGSTTEVDVPLSVPEIVEGIKFLLSARGPAVVGIDELDKIESVDKARDFLNEIKGILEAKQTHFLVSMSEDAIARFERRGLPFRDVFDSAFDEVVRVPYLTARQAHRLLDGRITNVPEPFLMLAYCLSGGLPRDLLRAMDRMIGLGTTDGPGASMSSIVREVVHRDLAGKTEAVTAAIKSILIEPDVSALLRCLHRLDVCEPAGPRQRPCLLDDSWLDALGKLSPLLTSDDTNDLGERRELLRLTVELVGYFYYCRTLLEVFDVDTESSVDWLIEVATSDNGHALDDLARARQNFAVNPFVAWEQLTLLRDTSALRSFTLPDPLVVRGRAPYVPGSSAATLDVTTDRSAQWSRP